MTSCASNIIGTAWKRDLVPSDTKYDESDFTGDHQYDELDGYMKSKIRQEQELKEWFKEMDSSEEISKED